MKLSKSTCSLIIALTCFLFAFLASCTPQKSTCYPQQQKAMYQKTSKNSLKCFK